MAMKRLLALAAMVFFCSLTASASPVSLGSWYEFSFTAPDVPTMGCAPADPLAGGCSPSSAGNSVFAPAPLWTITLAAPTALWVTDAFLSGDSFRVYDASILILTTPGVASGANCGSDPLVCFNNPAISHGSVLLGTGAHELQIIPNATVSGGGAAYFGVGVPEPVTMVLLGSGLLALGLTRRFRRS